MIIRKRLTLEWWQTGLFKLALLCIGIVIGTLWADVFAPYVVHIGVVGLVSAAYIWWVWAQQ